MKKIIIASLSLLMMLSGTLLGAKATQGVSSNFDFVYKVYAFRDMSADLNTFVISARSVLDGLEGTDEYGYSWSYDSLRVGHVKGLSRITWIEKKDFSIDHGIALSVFNPKSLPNGSKSEEEVKKNFEIAPWEGPSSTFIYAVDPEYQSPIGMQKVIFKADAQYDPNADDYEYFWNFRISDQELIFKQGANVEAIFPVTQRPVRAHLSIIDNAQNIIMTQVVDLTDIAAPLTSASTEEKASSIEIKLTGKKKATLMFDGKDLVDVGNL